MDTHDVDKSTAGTPEDLDLWRRTRLDEVEQRRPKYFHEMLAHLSPQDRAYIRLRLWVLEEGVS
jgi:hypothetical protein